MIAAVPSAFAVRSTPPADLGAFGSAYLLPLGMCWGSAAGAMIASGAGLPLAGGGSYGAAGVVWRDGGQANIAAVPARAVPASLQDRIDRIAAPRGTWAGFALDRPLVMGIVNATPDSFSDGGDNYDPKTAIATALSMVEAGADIIDVGGESTRPGAAPVSPEDEAARVLPVVSALAAKGVAVSIDTRHAKVMAAATVAGAVIINDVAALREPGAMAAAAQSGAAICLMHMLGEPGTMQQAPDYACAPLDVYDFLAERIEAARQAGISLDRIVVDPGIGFGKTADHNAQILDALALLHGLGAGILLGVSRKRFVAALSRDEMPKQRFPGSLAAAQIGLDAGARIVRVHDVAETVQAVTVWRAIRGT